MFDLLSAIFRWISDLFQSGTNSAPTSSSAQTPTKPTTRYDANLDRSAGIRPAAARDGGAPRGPSDNAPNAANLDYFPWPNTAALGGKGNLSTAVFTTKEGLLSYCGYKVGANGLPLDPRRKILDAIFLAQLPPIDDPVYRAQWGEPRSAKRLQKLAETMAAFVRNAKRRDAARMEKSIREWETDLAYLKRRHYDNRFSFPWPPTAIDKI